MPHGDAINLTHIISELKSELSALDEAIAALDRLARTKSSRRGRLPLMLLQSAKTGAAPRRTFSEETRKKMAAAQKKRWAAFRRAKGKKNGEGQ